MPESGFRTTLRSPHLFRDVLEAARLVLARADLLVQARAQRRHGLVHAVEHEVGERPAATGEDRANLLCGRMG